MRYSAPAPTADLLTFAQVADALGLHPETVRRLVASGALRAVPLWRSVRVPRTDVLRLATVRE